MQQSPPTCDPTRLEDEFPKWLDKISSRLPNEIILFIDGAENLEVSYCKLLIPHKGPVKLMQRVKIAYSFLQSVSNLLSFIILSLLL